MNAKGIRALTLLSGGLDSRLAVCVLKDQDIDVEGVVFESPFFGPEAAKAAAEQLKVRLHVVDFTRDIILLLDKPKHGFGTNMNPCVDCHARMLKIAGDMMGSLGCGFLCTGEVLNERPMSQNRAMLGVVARESGHEDLILRPLSAGLLAETKPEKEGWVDRARLLSLHGRSRKPQMELAARYGLKDFPTPAGGCRLTEPNFSRRLRDLKEHEGLGDVRMINLLKVGRHFRLDGGAKLIVGRNQGDNALIERLASADDILLTLQEIAGPSAILTPGVPAGVLKLAAEICARYGDFLPGEPVKVDIRSGESGHMLEVLPSADDKLARIRL